MEACLVAERAARASAWLASCKTLAKPAVALRPRARANGIARRFECTN